MPISATTALIVGTVVSAVGAVAGGVSSYMQGQAQAGMARQQANSARQQATYAREMALRNQALSETAAQNAENKGAYEAGLAKERAQTLLAKQIALVGASGVDMYGSPLEVMGQSAAEGKRDQNMILYNAAYDAWKFRTAGETSLLEGQNVGGRFDTQAGLYDYGAGNAQSQGTYGLIGGIGSAGTSILTGYEKYQYGAGGGYGGTGYGDGPYTRNPNVWGSGR